MKHLITTAAFAIASIFTPVIAQHDHSTHANAPAEKPATEAQKRVGDPWPLDTCVVAGSKLGSMGDPIIKLHEGREVRFCCAGCIGAFERDPQSYLAKADETIISQQRALYPLDYCIVDTAEKIGDDDSENALAVIGNRLFVFCCPPCEETVRANPVDYFATLDKAVAEQQRMDYPLETCAVSGQPLDAMGGPLDVVIGNQLIQLCCKGCLSKVEENPAGILAKVAEARKAAAAPQVTE